MDIRLADSDLIQLQSKQLELEASIKLQLSEIENNKKINE